MLYFSILTSFPLPFPAFLLSWSFSTIINRCCMPKQVIVIMEQNYPFGQCEQITSENTRVLVRKIYEVSVQQRNRLLQKVGILRRLKNEHMIKIESVLEEEESVHFLFEYIPIKLETWISNINDQFIENFRDQLIKFSAFLANNYIKIDFQLKNIGMDQNYGAKYFLDLDFTYDTSLNREKLKSMYIREITNLFKPYIVSTPSPSPSPAHNYTSPNYNNPLDSERNQYKKEPAPKNTPETRKVQDNSISPPTNRPNNASNNSKNKEKALAQYYQDVNMSVDSENEKILQEFMDVLDNQGEDQVKNHPPPLMAKPQQQSQPAPQRTQPPPFAKQPSQPLPTQSYQQQQNSSFQQANNYQQQQQYSQQQATSSRQIQTNNEFQPTYNNQFHSQNNITNLSGQVQVQTARQGNNGNNANNVTSQSMGRGKSEIKEPPQMEMWRESADLQNRVKNAIEKSMTVIKKFKAIKDNSQL